jgi:hypothetical protein
MPRTPKIVTRSETTSSNTVENLNKGSKLTFAEMDSNFIELKNGSFGVVADDSATIDVKAGDTLYVQGTGGIQTSTDSAGQLTIDGSNLSSLGDLTAIGSTLVSPSNAAITLDPAGTGTIELNANTNITGDLAVSGSISGAGITFLSNVVEDTTPQLGGDLDVNQKDITSVSDHWVRIQPDGDGFTLIKKLALGDNAGEDGIGDVRYNLDFDNNNQLKLYRTNALSNGAGGTTIVHSEGAIIGGYYQTSDNISPTSNGTTYFQYDRYGITAARDTNLTFLFSGAMNSMDTSSDNNKLELYFKKVDMPNHNVTFTIGNEGNLKFQSDAGTPHITLYENANDGKIEIMPKAGKPVVVDTVSIDGDQIGGTTSLTLGADFNNINSRSRIVLGSASPSNSIWIYPDAGSGSQAGIRIYDPDNTTADVLMDFYGSGKTTIQSGGTLELVSAGTPAADLIALGASRPFEVMLTTNAAKDLVLSTNLDTNSGTIRITDGVNGDISLSPNGTGNLVIDAPIINSATNGDIKISPNGTGAIDVDTSRIINVTDPTSAQDAATKAYVDAQSSTSSITFVGDDSTGTAVNNGETFKIAGTQNITTAVSGDTLTITGPDLTSYLTAETNDLTSAVTWANVPDANITQSSVTQHQAALSITESQISDLQSYITDANITIVGDDSTGVTFSAKNNDDITITGTGGITSTVSGNTITIDGSGVSGGGSATGLTFVGDDSTGTLISDGETIKIAGGTNITTAVSGDTITVTGPDLSSYLTTESNDLSSAVTWANVPDANITQSSVTQHQAALSVTESQISDLQSYLTAETFTSLAQDTTPQLGGDLDLNGNDIVTTSNADIELAPNGTGHVVVKGNSNDGAIQLNCTANTHGQKIKAQPHSEAVTNEMLLPKGSDSTLVSEIATQTLTNKTLTSPVLNTGVSGTAILDEDNMASNSATQLATQQSIKAYVDAEVAGAGGGGVTVQDEGSALSTTGTTLNFVGAGVTASGTGATKTITIPGGGGSATGLTFVGDDSTGTLIADGETVKIAGGTGITTAMSGDTLTITASGSASTGDFAFIGNNMSTGSSNADMELEASGTGSIKLQANGAPDINAGELEPWTTSDYRVAGATHIHDVITGITPGNREYKYDSTLFKTDGGDSSSSSARFRKQTQVMLDLNGSELTNTGSSRGLQIQNAIYTLNSDTVNDAVVGTNGGSVVYSVVGNDGTTNYDGSIAATNNYGLNVQTALVTNNASTTNSVTNGYGVSVAHYQYGPGTQTMTNYTAFDYKGGGADATNTPYLLNTTEDKIKTRPGALEKFNEWSYNATHSSGGTYTIDWANGNLQTVTLTSNITGFTMSNFPTDSNQSVGVTLYLVQDGTGSRTMTFSASGGETFKFANGSNSSSVSSANDIQVCYIFSRYDGTNNTFYWTLGPAFS